MAQCRQSRAALQQLLSCLLVWLFGNGLAQAETLDWQDWNLNQAAIRSLDMKWDVVWGRWVSPTEIVADPDIKDFEAAQRDLIRWEAFKVDDVMERRGLVTLSSKVLLPEIKEPISLSVPRFGQVYRVYVNGELLAEVGHQGTTLAEDQPALRPLLLDLPKARELHIVLQMSNDRGAAFGPNRYLQLGRTDAFANDLMFRFMADFFVIGAIFVMCFYHFALYFLRPEEPAAFFFGLFCMILGFRHMLVGEGAIFALTQYASAVPYVFGYRVEFLCFATGMLAFHAFCAALYPDEVKRIQRVLTQASFGAYALIIVSSEPIVFGRFLNLFQILALLSGSFCLLSLARAVRVNRDGSKLFTLGFVVLFACLTNDILHGNGIIKSIPLITFGLFGFIFIQSVILSKRFAKAFERARIAEREVRSLNDALEFKVIERTRTIRTILDNVKSGFLMLGPDLRIKDGFTKSCSQLFGVELVAGTAFSDYFRLAARDKSFFELALKQVFNDQLPEEVSLSQIPERVPLGARVLGLQGALVRNQQGRGESILLTVNDATALVTAENETKKNAALLKIIGEKSSFRAFLADSLQLLDSCRRAIEARRDGSDIAMSLHTLKGNFALFGLRDIAHIVHELEEKTQVTREDIQNIIELLNAFLKEHEDLLGLRLDQLDTRIYQVSGDSLHEMRQELDAFTLPTEFVQRWQRWFAELQRVPIRELLGPIDANVKRVADTLGKELRFVAEGLDIRVDSERFRLPLKNLIHALINSIDHGIEYPEERGDKDPVGTVTLLFRIDGGDQLTVIVSDDGRGLDLELIKEKALERGVVSEADLARMTHEEIRLLIFRQGFSTKTDVSEFSGRGVGVAALEFAVKSMGGEMHIQSISGKGTTLWMTMPLYAQELSPLQDAV